MKKILTLAILFFALTSNAQYFQKDTTLPTYFDSSKIIVSLTMKAEYHFLIFDIVDGISKPEMASYASQVAKAMDTTYKPAKAITVSLESGFILDLFTQISAQQERFSADLNNDIRNVLLPQLSNYPWLYRELISVRNQNGSLLQQRKLRGYNLLKQIKAK
jgi:hypothetical protein